MKLTEEQYKERFAEESSPGWDAIDEVLNKIYPEQEPRHYATILKYMMGGEDPLDGISIYDQNQQQFHRHIISYGMSELYYSPESADGEYSKWGFEFTFRIVPYHKDKTENEAKNEPLWATNLMQNLARYVFQSKKWFEPYHFIPTMETIRSETDTQLEGIAFVTDPQLGVIQTPNGEVTFLQMVGLTRKEIDWISQKSAKPRLQELIDRMKQDNPLLITDLKRVKSYVD